MYDFCSEGGIGVGGFKGYIEKLKASGSSNLVELISKLEVSANPLSCPVYDASFTLVLDIAKQLDVGRVAVAVFFTQSCAAIAIYCAMHLEMLDVTTVGLGRFPTYSIDQKNKKIHKKKDMNQNLQSKKKIYNRLKGYATLLPNMRDFPGQPDE